MSRGEKNPLVYVSHLSNSIREKDLDQEFAKYGNIKSISLKNGFAFIEYEDYRDADDAIENMDGKTFEGQKLTVQHAGKEKNI
jgi:arginine/serine-rich splicing factor 4/5/6